MLRTATCDDMTALLAEAPTYEFKPGGTPWSLKRFGYLTVRRVLATLPPGPILEAGAGFGTIFAEWYAATHEYWMADKAGFYDPERFEAAHARRGPTRFVNTLLGENHPDLPERHFLATFSVSVLEHVPQDQRVAVAQDLFRITRPGGVTVHSIDTTVLGTVPNHREWLAAFTTAGFVFEPGSVQPPSTTTRSADGKALLIEPMDLRPAYFRMTPEEFLTKRPSVPDHFTTICCIARRPD